MPCTFVQNIAYELRDNLISAKKSETWRFCYLNIIYQQNDPKIN